MLSFINENWKLKVLALGCALVLWIYVMGERRLEVAYAVPVELKNVPQGMIVTNDLPKTIDIRLSGPRALLVDLNQQDVRISIDLVDLKPGTTTISRLDDHLNLPRGVHSTRITPSYIDIKLERIIEKMVPLRARLVGQLSGDYQLVAVDVQPQRVLVRGAEGELAGINEVMTEKIDLGGMNEGKELTVALDYRGKYSQVQDAKNASVRLQIKGTTRDKVPAKNSKEGKL